MEVAERAGGVCVAVEEREGAGAGAGAGAAAEGGVPEVEPGPEALDTAEEGTAEEEEGAALRAEAVGGSALLPVTVVAAAGDASGMVR